MKFNFKEKMKSVDSDLIDELISKAEAAMVHPLRKKKPEVEVMIAELEGDSEEDSQAHEDGESDAVEKDEDTIDPEMQKLIELYRELKD